MTSHSRNKFLVFCCACLTVSTVTISAGSEPTFDSGPATGGLFDRLDLDANGTIDASEWNRVGALQQWSESSNHAPQSPLNPQQFAALYEQFMRDVLRQHDPYQDGDQSTSDEPAGGVIASFRPIGHEEATAFTGSSSEKSVIVLTNLDPQPGGDEPPPLPGILEPNHRSPTDRRRTAARSQSKRAEKRSVEALPPRYRSRDTDADGQIGLYEWPTTDALSFVELDGNRDGFLTSRELARVARKPQGSRTSQANRRAGTATRTSKSNSLPFKYRPRDKNRDGQIGFYEWPQSDIETFQELDRNFDGFLTGYELGNWPKRQRIRYSTDQQKRRKRAAVMFQRLDRDRNGVLDAAEMRRSDVLQSTITPNGAPLPAELPLEDFVERYLKIPQPEL